MENNKFKASTDEDDFWGILSGSDGSEDDEISMLFKSRIPENTLDNDNKEEPDVCNAMEEREGGIEGVGEEEDEVSVMNDAQTEESHQPFDVKEDDTEVSIESMDEGSDVLDGSWAKETKKEHVEDSQKTCSVDDMGFIWDDDEEFVLGASKNNMKIHEKNGTSNGPEKMGADDKYAVQLNARHEVMNEVCENIYEESICSALINENDEMYDEIKEEDTETNTHDEIAEMQENSDKYTECVHANGGVNVMKGEIEDGALKNEGVNKQEDMQSVSNRHIRGVSSCKKANIMMPKPLVKFICGTVFTVWKSSQKRFNMQGEAVMASINVSQCYRLEYVIPSIKRSEFERWMKEGGAGDYRDVYAFLRLKNPCVESIANIVYSTRPVYCESDVCWKVEAECINEFVRLCFVDEEKAFEYALEKEMWGLGIMLPNNGQEIKKKAIERMMNPSCVPFVSVALGESYSCLKMSGEWKRYLREVLLLKNREICHDFIMEVYKCGAADALFVVLACHVVGIVDASKYLWMFSRNFEAIGALCYAESVYKPIQDLDILKYEFVCVGMEFDKAKAEEYFNANRKCFRKELTVNIGPQLDSKWSFGLKSVFDFGIKKILNVDSFEESPSEMPSRHGGLQLSTSAGCFDGKSLSLKEIERALQADDNQESVGAINVIGAAESVYNNDKIAEVCIRRPETLLSENEHVPAAMPCVSSESGMESRNENDKLFVDECPKSFADFFEEQNATCPEDVKDTGAFLSKFAIEEDGAEMKEEKVPKKAGGSSFFGFLSMFKKESIHKVSIDVDDDFKYDPIEKKWIGGTPSKANGEETAAMRSRSIPKPSSGGSNERCVDTTDTSVASVYANRRRVDRKGIPGTFNRDVDG